MLDAVLISVAVLGGLGLLFGLGLGLASKKFSVERDPKIDEIKEFMPGANCGGCGYPGCEGLADALVKGTADISSCAALSEENASKIAEILGISLSAGGKKKFARVLCSGGKGISRDLFKYKGISDCRAAYLISKGSKDCSFGCIGLGTCVSVCPFGAISLTKKGIAQVDEKKCTACGKCMEACPKDCIRLADDSMSPYMKCRNVDKGKDITAVCKAGCIGCGLCAKNCPTGAITMVDNLPVFNYSKCDKCGLCVQKCPVKVIVFKEEDNI